MKEKRIKSAIPIYGCAAVWVLLGLVCPGMLLKMWFIVLAAALSTGVYFALSKVFPGRIIEVREAANSGDKAIDAMIEEGRKKLDAIAAANAAISDAAISEKLDRMVKAGEEILSIMEREPAQVQAVRRFLNYYLPTAEKLISSYRLMLETDGTGENIGSAMESIKNSLAMIADAFEKQMDNLYRNHALDIETDIEVLETMLAGDGLIPGVGMQHAQKNP